MLDLGLEGKRAFITGSTSGIGEAAAKLLAANGVSVVVHGRNEERGRRVLQEILDAGGKARLVLGDVRSDAAVRTVVREAHAFMGGVDILVNSAGEFQPLKAFEIPPEAWLAIYDNNMVGYVRTAQAFAPAMRERGWGRIINISSRGGSMGREIAAHYAATKAANLSLTLSLADALKGTGVTVNAISPGEVDTPGARRFFAQLLGVPEDRMTWEEAEKQMIKGPGQPNNVGRLGRVEDIAGFIAILASPISDWVTGQNIHIDGGSTKNVY